MHAPYAPTSAGLGGVPTVHLDVPITAIFLTFFLFGAVAHMTIFQLNRRHGHKFIMSGLMFGFCMARIASCVMRIVWATRPTSVSIAIAAQVFVAAGVILLFVINILFAQRLLRASHPHVGWHPLFSRFFQVIYVLIVVSLVMLITVVVQSFYTLSQNTRRIDRDIQLYGQTLFAVVAFLPIPLVIGGLIIPRRTRVEKFGSGRFRTKIEILLFAAVLLCLGASFRAGTNYMTPRQRNDPAWYHSKACFYVFNFAVEVIVIWLYFLVRVDLRFYIPNGSKGPGDYSGQNLKDGGEQGEVKTVRRLNTEEEVFDDMPEEQIQNTNGNVRDIEREA
ncbi:hypothetical protein MMC24_007592 [Lignoscripta atroalba]|nr:hypothetical protein [Lignoscripta atroalba]